MRKILTLCVLLMLLAESVRAESCRIRGGDATLPMIVALVSAVALSIVAKRLLGGWRSDVSSRDIARVTILESLVWLVAALILQYGSDLRHYDMPPVIGYAGGWSSCNLTLLDRELMRWAAWPLLSYPECVISHVRGAPCDGWAIGLLIAAGFSITTTINRPLVSGRGLSGFAAAAGYALVHPAFAALTVAVAMLMIF